MPALVVVLVIAAIVLAEFIAFWRSARDDVDADGVLELGD